MNRPLTALDVLRDPVLAPHALGERPVWIFAADGSRLIFANPSGAALLGFNDCHAAAGSAVTDTELATRIARSAEQLTPDARPRLERLRGVGAGFGRLLTCACSKIAAGPDVAILVAAVETCGPVLPLAERVRRLLDGSDAAIAVFDAGDNPIYRTPKAAQRGTGITSLSDVRGEAQLTAAGTGPNAVTIAELDDAKPVDLAPIAQAMATMTGADARPQPADASARAEPLRRHPLRFVWETDADNRFRIAGDEFLALAGPRTVNLLGRFWGEISAKLALDPEGVAAHAMVSRDTWSGVTVQWPLADGSRVPVDLSGIPAFEHDQVFRGYRGLGVWRGPADDEDPAPAPTPQSLPEADVVVAAADVPIATAELAAAPEPASAADETDSREPIAPAAEPEVAQPAPENVVPFPAGSHDGKGPGLNPVERTAFSELGSKLAARLRDADELARGQIEPSSHDEPAHKDYSVSAAPIQTQTARDLRPDIATLGSDQPILDRLPLGVLIYRLSTFLYANPAFLQAVGHASLGDFAQAGGLDSLFIEPDSHSSAEADGGQLLRIVLPNRDASIAGRLFTAQMDGENVMVLALMAGTAGAAPQPKDEDHSQSDALASILDLAADGVVILDRDGTMLEANAGAARLFGYDASELAGRAFGSLFAPESERMTVARLERVVKGNAPDDAREITGRRRQGGALSLHLVVGRVGADAERYCAVFRDITRWKDTEDELVSARHQAERASSAKSEFLAKISHEMRTPLNAIIGFSDVMMEERFGPVGNDRYRDYLRDINASGSQLVSLLNDLLDLSKIEAGKMELSFERVNLNDLTQQSVAIMQAQASRARIIVRTALSMNVPHIIADARSVRQIVLNLLSNSIKFTAAGGQVIVSTAATERGEVMLRVRDTGVGMSAKDIESALQPFRQLATASRTDANGTGLGLPLTKALVEANRARFSIKSAVNAGTLVEIVFPAARVLAE